MAAQAETLLDSLTGIATKSKGLVDVFTGESSPPANPSQPPPQAPGGNAEAAPKDNGTLPVWVIPSAIGAVILVVLFVVLGSRK